MEKQKGVIEKVVNVFMWLAALFIILLLAYLMYLSFREPADVLSNTLGVPETFTINNYIRVFINQSFHRYFINSVIILVFSVLLLVILSSFVAYALGRYKFRGNGFLRIFFLLGMMFPVQLGVVPIFLLISDMNLMDSYTAVILILGTSISMPVLMLTQFFADLPDDIYESATVDGAGEFTIFFKIMFPIAQPVVSAVVIINAVNIWNQFFIPLIFLQSENKKTIPLLLEKYTGNLLVNIDYALAASVLSTIPILIFFMIYSRKVLASYMSGAVKG